MKTKKGLAALLLAATMASTMLPVQAAGIHAYSPADSWDETEEIPEGYVRVNFDGNGGRYSYMADDGRYYLDDWYDYFPAGSDLGYGQKAPKRDGYSFMGYSTTKDGPLVIDEYGKTGTVTVTDGMTLYAVWQEPITVNYHCSHGFFYEHNSAYGEDSTYRGDVAVQYHPYCTTIGFPEDEGKTNDDYVYEKLAVAKTLYAESSEDGSPDRDNYQYTFVGYATTENGKAVITPENHKTIALKDGMDLYAVWKKTLIGDPKLALSTYDVSLYTGKYATATEKTYDIHISGMASYPHSTTIKKATTSNKKVATVKIVNDNGTKIARVTAKKNGKATITITGTNGLSKKVSVKVTTYKPKPNMFLKVGGTRYITEVAPESIKDPANFKYEDVKNAKSMDSKVATVKITKKNGKKAALITAKKKGMTIITITGSGGSTDQWVLQVTK